jgi:hypothetical protein
MGLFAVTTTMKTQKGDQVWFPFDVPGIETVDQFHEILDEQEIIKGDRLKVRKDPNGFMHEIERDRLSIGIGIIGMVTLMNRERLLTPVA